MLGVPGETNSEAAACRNAADCDGPMFQNETVAVIGGGDSALQEALVLTHYCGKVLLNPSRRGVPRTTALHRPGPGQRKNRTPLGTTVEAIVGGQMVENLRLRGAAGTEEIPCAGVFAYIGLEPNTGFLPAGRAVRCARLRHTGDTLETAVSGLWAVGAVRSGCGGSLADAMAEARRAADAVAARLK